MKLFSYLAWPPQGKISGSITAQLITSQQDLGLLKGQQIITQMISAFHLDYATKTHQDPLLYYHCNNLSQVDKLLLNTSQPITACLHTTKGNQTISQYGVSCFFNLTAFQSSVESTFLDQDGNHRSRRTLPPTSTKLIRP